MTAKIKPSGLIVLVGCGCGEKTVLGGPQDVWLSGRTTFECKCGRRITLADRVAESSCGPGSQPLPQGSYRSSLRAS